MPTALTYKYTVLKRHKQVLAHDLRLGFVLWVAITSKTWVNFW